MFGVLVVCAVGLAGLWGAMSGVLGCLCFIVWHCVRVSITDVCCVVDLVVSVHDFLCFRDCTCWLNCGWLVCC